MQITLAPSNQVPMFDAGQRHSFDATCCWADGNSPIVWIEQQINASRKPAPKGNRRVRR